MAKSVVKGTKVVLKLAEGSQTISGCKLTATDTELYALGSAVSKLEAERVDQMTKVVESTLINE